MSGYHRRRRSKIKKRYAVGVVIFLLIGVLGAAGIYIYTKLSLINRDNVKESDIQISDTFKNTEQTKAASSSGDEEEEPNPYSGYEIIALVGLDTRTASEQANSDTMIFACINHDEETIRLFSLYRDTYLNIGNGRYNKANAAYCTGGAVQFLSMVNMNLDLNVTKYVTTNFNALADAINILGGLDIDMTREELIHMNNYNVETSQVCGVEYEAVEVPDDVSFDGVRTRTFHLTGTQAVSYARIRYTEGWDYKRTERQRIVLEKIKDKLKDADLSELVEVIDKVFPQISTNLTDSEILSLAKSVLSYDIIDQFGFPFDKTAIDIDGLDAVVPTTLESNVIQLHQSIYPGVSYEPSATVKEYSSYIAGHRGTTSSVQSSSSDKKTTTTPTPTVKPTPTPTVKPTATPAPTAEPTPEPTAEPVPTEEPQPEPTAEPEPTEEPQPEPTEEPQPDPSGEDIPAEQSLDE